jgi:tetratricopeptide (TPR) repeat protein
MNWKTGPNQSNKPAASRKARVPALQLRSVLYATSPRITGSRETISVEIAFRLPKIRSHHQVFVDNCEKWKDHRSIRLEHRYTRSEVERMLGVSRRELDYWTRLRLVMPRSRWGERFFNFSDLVTLETIKRLAARKIPARRIRNAIGALEAELGHARGPLSELHISTNGKQVVVHAAKGSARPFEPLTGQFVLNFETAQLAKKIHTMASRSAEEWFEIGMEYDSSAESLEQAAEAYRKAVHAAPDWVEARINLGTSLYQLDRLEEAREQFAAAIAVEPQNGLAEFNLGCVLDQLGHADESIKHLLRSVELAPSLADAHLNLALAYEKLGHTQDTIHQLSLYLRYEPNGPWSDFARKRIASHRNSRQTSAPSGKLTPFRRTQ